MSAASPRKRSRPSDEEEAQDCKRLKSSGEEELETNAAKALLEIPQHVAWFLFLYRACDDPGYAGSPYDTETLTAIYFSPTSELGKTLIRVIITHANNGNHVKAIVMLIGAILFEKQLAKYGHDHAYGSFDTWKPIETPEKLPRSCITYVLV